MRIVLYQEFGEACRRLAHELLPEGWPLVDIPHAGPRPGPLAPEYAEAIRASDAIIASPLSVLPDELYEAGRGTRLRLIQLLSAGYDKVDLDRCREAGLLVATNGGANAVAVAEHTILLILAVLRRLPVIDGDTRAGRWHASMEGGWEPHELEGRTVGLVGLGRIGREVAARLVPFGVTTQYYDVVQVSEEMAHSLQVKYVSWDELLATSDVISLHVPLMEETRYLVGADELARMKPGAILINNSRGGLVDEAALAAALRDGRLAGAGLDTFAEEPLGADHPLAALPQVVLTPHLAGPTYESWPKRVRFAYENIGRLARGERPQSVVPELADLPLRAASQ